MRKLWGMLVLLMLAAPAEAKDLKVATWNLGWHMSQEQASTWIAKCSAPFAKNSQTGLWEPAASGKAGWELKWGRDAPIVWDISAWPPCDVYQASFNIVPVTKAAYAKRSEQIANFISGKLQPDIIAFQEVSGEQAIRDVLPDGGADYLVCSFEGFKVQRLGFAWRKELGPAKECAVEAPVSLPALAPKNQVRPGLALGLEIDGQRVRLLNVHLKSSCVTPIEADASSDRGVLAGTDEACTTLQQQVAPLEKWIETQAADADELIVLGDFNRAIWHEQHDAGPVRTDGSDPTGPMPPAAKVSNLIKEINDLMPADSALVLLRETCPVSAVAETACNTAEHPASKDEWRAAIKLLATSDNLGCRNPAGLDHILTSGGLSAPNQAQKVTLGKQGRTLIAGDGHPDPLLALSDHCPLVASVAFQSPN